MRSLHLLLAPMLLAGAYAADPARAQTEGDALRGIIRAVNEAAISSDLAFPITKLPFREGEAFLKGDVLAEFECSGLKAELKSAEAVERAERITYDNNDRLAKSRAAGRFEVQMSQAKADQAAAEVEALQSRLSRCVIQAPFDGRIAGLYARAYELPRPNQPMMHIVGSSGLLIDTLLPSHWLQWLKPGMAFTISIDETGKTLPAVVTQISAVVDPVSQTVKVSGKLTNGATDVLPGMSGPTTFKVPGG